MFFDTKEGLSYIKCIKIAFFDYYSVKIIFCLINRKLIESPQKVEQNFFIFSLTIPSLYGIVDIVLMNTI